MCKAQAPCVFHSQVVELIPDDDSWWSNAHRVWRNPELVTTHSDRVCRSRVFRTCSRTFPKGRSFCPPALSGSGRPRGIFLCHACQGRGHRARGRGWGANVGDRGVVPVDRRLCQGEGGETARVGPPIDSNAARMLRALRTQHDARRRRRTPSLCPCPYPSRRACRTALLRGAQHPEQRLIRILNTVDAGRIRHRSGRRLGNPAWVIHTQTGSDSLPAADGRQKAP